MSAALIQQEVIKDGIWKQSTTIIVKEDYCFVILFYFHFKGNKYNPHCEETFNYVLVIILNYLNPLSYDQVC